MKKLNWGTKLGLMASIYVIGILTFVVFSTTQKINLVSRDYYPDEVKYEDQISKIKNANAITGLIHIQQIDGNIKIQFPENMRNDVHGEIVMYRPSDFESDIKLPLNLNKEGIQLLNTKNLLQGRYTVKLDWIHKSVPYYKEEAIYLNK